VRLRSPDAAHVTARDFLSELEPETQTRPMLEARWASRSDAPDKEATGSFAGPTKQTMQKFNNIRHFSQSNDRVAVLRELLVHILERIDGSAGSMLNAAVDPRWH
jgi:hypothetical protein